MVFLINQEARGLAWNEAGIEGGGALAKGRRKAGLATVSPVEEVFEQGPPISKVVLVLVVALVPVSIASYGGDTVQSPKPI